MEQNTCITITRQYGSGGREISGILAKKLGFHRYDRKIVEMAAERVGSGLDIESLIEESYNTPEQSLSALGDYSFGGATNINRMYVEQAKAILQIAEKGGAVFLGRCADYILKDRPNTYSFFIYADDAFRDQRSEEKYGNLSVAALDREAQKRAGYYAYYTGQTWGNPANYDLMVNAARMPFEEIADLLIDYIEKRQKA